MSVYWSALLLNETGIAFVQSYVYEARLNLGHVNEISKTEQLFEIRVKSVNVH